MNPINDIYSRSQMNPYGQQMLPFFQRQPQINCRFVTNVEEARASMIDGLSYNLFVDSGTGKIYLKKLNNNGLADFITYAVEEPGMQKDPIEDINERLTNIENFLGGIKNDKSVSSNDKSSAVFGTAVAEQNERHDETEPTGFSKNAGNGWRKN